jgi:hypothetical protein
MAGAGFKTWVDGDILTAADVNTYLMEQAVMVFATATARSTALPTPSEGMVSYLADSNVVEVYTGAAWVSLDDPNAIQNSIVDAKGDIITATADNTPARLAVGTNGYVLSADSAETTGLKWIPAASGGKVLQVVSATYATSTTVSTTSFTDTGLTASITPSANTSKVLVLVSQPIEITRSFRDQGMAVRLMRGATEIYETGGSLDAFSMYLSLPGLSPTSISLNTVHPIAYLDSPATTSSTTYKTQIRPYVTTNSGVAVAQTDSSTSSMILIEIGA